MKSAPALVLLTLLGLLLAWGGHVQAWSLIRGTPDLGTGFGQRIATSRGVLAVAYATGHRVELFRLQQADPPEADIRSGVHGDGEPAASVTPLGALQTPCNCHALAMNEHYLLCSCDNQLAVYDADRSGPVGPRSRDALPFASTPRLLRIRGNPHPDALDLHDHTAIVGMQFPHAALVFNNLRLPRGGGPRKLSAHENATAEAYATSVATRDGYAAVGDPHMRRNGAKVLGMEFSGSIFTHCRNADGPGMWGVCRDRIFGPYYRAYWGRQVLLGRNVLVSRGESELVVWERARPTDKWRLSMRVRTAPYSDASLTADGGSRLLLVTGSYRSDEPWVRLQGWQRSTNQASTTASTLSSRGSPSSSSSSTSSTSAYVPWLRSVRLVDTGNAGLGTHPRLTTGGRGGRRVAWVLLPAPSLADPTHSHSAGGVFVFSVDELERADARQQPISLAAAGTAIAAPFTVSYLPSNRSQGAAAPPAPLLRLGLHLLLQEDRYLVLLLAGALPALGGGCGGPNVLRPAVR